MDRLKQREIWCCMLYVVECITRPWQEQRRTQCMIGNGEQTTLIKQRPETQNYIKAEQSTWIECMLSYLTESFEFPEYHGNRQCQYRKDKGNWYQSELHFLQSFLCHQKNKKKDTCNNNDKVSSQKLEMHIYHCCINCYYSFCWCTVRPTSLSLHGKANVGWILVQKP